MSVSIQIDPAGLNLSRGKTSSIRVLVSVTQATKVRGISADFHAAERTEATYTVTTTDSKGRARTETRTAVEHVDIVRESFQLFGARRLGFFNRLFDSLMTWFGGGSHEVLQPGEYEYSVDVTIPGKAPYSFKGKKCEVFYRLSVKVDLPIRYDPSVVQDFMVEPIPVPFHETNPVHVVFPDESGRSFWDRTFGKDVTLNLAIDRDTVVPGERALGMLTVESPEPLKVSKIEPSLVGVERTSAQGHTDSHRHVYPLGTVDSPQVISSESVHEFEILVPDLDGPFSQQGAKYDIGWGVEVRLHIPWAKDPTIRVPIQLLPPRNSGASDNPYASPV